MEEDIKILEDETNALGLFFKCNGTGKYKQALENLLKRYKELEEDNKELKKYYASRKEVEDLKETIACLHESSKEMFIPTSVIQKYKEKFLEDSKNEKVFMTQSTQINASLISFCDELLEERNK